MATDCFHDIVEQSPGSHWNTFFIKAASETCDFETESKSQPAEKKSKWKDALRFHRAVRVDGYERHHLSNPSIYANCRAYSGKEVQTVVMSSSQVKVSFLFSSLFSLLLYLLLMLNVVS